MDKNINDIKMSFRVKLSYITHTNDNPRVFSKFCKIALLILSCGKYNLQLTKDKCEYVFQNHSRCLFSRKIKPIVDNDSGMGIARSLVINNDSVEVESRKFQCSVEGVDNLIKEIEQSSQDGDCKKDVTLMFNDCVNTCNHEVLNKLVSFSSKNQEKLPAEWMSFDSIDKNTTEKYVLNLIQTGDNQLDVLYEHVLIKNKLIDVKFGNNSDGRLPPLLLAIVSNNKDSLNALLRLNVDIPIKMVIPTKTFAHCDLDFDLARDHDDVLTELIKHYLHDDFETIYNYLEEKLKKNPGNNTREDPDNHDDLTNALRYNNLHAVKFLIEDLKKQHPNASLNDYKLSKNVDHTIMQNACFSRHVPSERYHQLGNKYTRDTSQITKSQLEILEYLLYTEKLELNDDHARLLAEDKSMSVECLNLVATYMKNKSNVNLNHFIILVNRDHRKKAGFANALAQFNNQDT